jgi:hypothetical protein
MTICDRCKEADTYSVAIPIDPYHMIYEKSYSYVVRDLCFSCRIALIKLIQDWLKK